MSAGITTLPRRVIPRWRDFHTTASLGECGAIGKSTPREKQPDFSQLQNLWAQKKGVPLAAEIISEAIVLNSPELAVEAAQYICAQSKSSNLLARETAEALLASLTDPDGTQIRFHSEKPLLDVKSVRRALRSFPHDPIGWCELARLHIINGHSDKARKAILVAVGLGKDNRYILRSATRCFLHLNEADIAHEILQKSQRTRKDPWLASAAIATSAIAERRLMRMSEFVNLSLDENIPAFHRSELLASLGAQHLADGGARKAKTEFALALKEPTENVIAQAYWTTTNRHLQLMIPSNLLHNPFTAEANTFEAIHDGQWEFALQSTRSWMLDEPFAGRPSIQAAFIKFTFYQEYTEAAEILKRAWVTNPRDNLIINNLAFCLASANQIELARRWIAMADIEHADPTDVICLIATYGLIEFRSGNKDLGRSLYRKAAQLALARNFPGLRATAIFHLAKEEELAGSEFAQRTVKEAEVLLGRLPDPLYKFLLAKIKPEPTIVL